MEVTSVRAGSRRPPGGWKWTPFGASSWMLRCGRRRQADGADAVRPLERTRERLVAGVAGLDRDVEDVAIASSAAGTPPARAAPAAGTWPVSRPRRRPRPGRSGSATGRPARRAPRRWPRGRRGGRRACRRRRRRCPSPCSCPTPHDDHCADSPAPDLIVLADHRGGSVRSATKGGVEGATAGARHRHLEHADSRGRPRPALAAQPVHVGDLLVRPCRSPRTAPEVHPVRRTEDPLERARHAPVRPAPGSRRSRRRRRWRPRWSGRAAARPDRSPARWRRAGTSGRRRRPDDRDDVRPRAAPMAVETVPSIPARPRLPMISRRWPSG